MTLSTSSLGLFLPWPYSSCRSPARDQRRLSGKVVVCGQNWAFDLTKKMPTLAALQYLQIHRPQKSIFEDFTSPSYWWSPPLSLSGPHSGTLFLQHLTHALNAQALSLELGSEAGQSGWPPSGSSVCLGTRWACGQQDYTLFYILFSLYAYEIANTFLLLDGNCRYLISVSHSPSWERNQLPRRTCGSCTSPPLAPLSGRMNPFP